MVVQSMFQRGKSKITKKRYRDDSKKQKIKALKQESDEKEVYLDEEVESTDEDANENLTENQNKLNFHVSEEEDDCETPAQKRVRLAKKYLADLAEDEEQASGNEEDLADRITQRLNEDRLEKLGKLRKSVANQYINYDPNTIKIFKHRHQKSPFTSVCLTPEEDFLFTGCKNDMVLKWHIESCKQVLKIDLRKENLKAKGRRFTNCMCISSDGKFLAIGDGSNDIQVYDPTTFKHLGLLNGHRSMVNGLVFRKNSHQLYSASADRSVRIWSLDEMVFVEALFGHQTPVTGIDALLKERAITSGGSDRSVRVWKIVEESQLIYTGHEGSIENVRLINEENFLTSGDDGQLCVWSVNKKKPLSNVKLAHGKCNKGHPNWISSIAVLLNTDLIASGSCDGYIRIWNLEEKFTKITELFTIPIIGFINDLRFIHGGDKIVACIGQEHRLGRWWTMKDAKNCLQIISLIKKDT